MSGPWDKYAEQPIDSGPWEKYAAEPPKAASPNNALMSANAANRAIAGIPDALLNTPNRLLNLGKAAFGTAATALGRSDLAPQMTEDPDLARKAFERMGFIKPELDPATTGQRMGSNLIQGAIGGLASPTSGMRHAVVNALAGGASGVGAGAVHEITGNDTLAMTAGMLTPSIAARSINSIQKRIPTKQPLFDAPQKPSKFLKGVDPDRAQLLKKASDIGMEITPGMVTDNKFVKLTEEMMGRIPLSGSREKGNRLAFQKKLIETIGGRSQGGKLTEKVFSDAMDASGGKIGEISASTPIPLDTDFQSALGAIRSDTNRYHTSDVGRIVNNYIDDLERLADANKGVVDGTAFRRLNSEIGRKIRNTSDGDLKSALSDVQETMFDALQRNVRSPDDLASLMDARRKYAIGKTIEPLVAKSINGDISPSALMARVTATGQGKTNMAMGHGGELGDLARIGQLLKEPGTSNTTERAVTYGVLGGGSLISPLAAGGLYAAANAFNRLGPKMAGRAALNSLPPPVRPAIAPFELGILDESPFIARPKPFLEPEYKGLLTLAEDEGFAKARQPVPSAQRLATRDDYPTMDFPLRQEVLQQPEISQAIDGFRQEAARLTMVSENAISPTVRAKAQGDLVKLQTEFAEGMKMLGISSPKEAIGLQPLYESGQTRLELKKTFDPRK